MRSTRPLRQRLVACVKDLATTGRPVGAALRGRPYFGRREQLDQGRDGHGGPPVQRCFQKPCVQRSETTCPSSWCEAGSTAAVFDQMVYGTTATSKQRSNARAPFATRDRADACTDCCRSGYSENHISGRMTAPGNSSAGGYSDDSRARVIGPPDSGRLVVLVFTAGRKICLGISIPGSVAIVEPRLFCRCEVICRIPSRSRDRSRPRGQSVLVCRLGCD